MYSPMALYSPLAPDPLPPGPRVTSPAAPPLRLLLRVFNVALAAAALLVIGKAIWMFQEYKHGGDAAAAGGPARGRGKHGGRAACGGAARSARRAGGGGGQPARLAAGGALAAGRRGGVPLVSCTLRWRQLGALPACLALPLLPCRCCHAAVQRHLLPAPGQSASPSPS